MPTTLLYGGSFDPIHFGHLITAQRAAELLAAERVIFIPARINPLKSAPQKVVQVTADRGESRVDGGGWRASDGGSRTDGGRVGSAEAGGQERSEHRLSMVKLAIYGEPRFLVDDFEITRPGPSFTIDTVEALLPKYGPHLTLLLGADQLLFLHRWHRVQDLLQKVEIAILGRPGVALDTGLASIGNYLGSNILDRLQKSILATPLIEISATDIRTRCQNRHSIAYLTPPAVVDYIAMHRLYV